MTYIRSARKLAGRAIRRSPREIRRAGLFYMLALTLMAALLAAGGVSRGTVLLASYGCFAAGLWIQAPLASAAHKGKARALRNMGPQRYVIAALLPALPLLPAWGLWELYERIFFQTGVLQLAEILKMDAGIYLALAAILGGAVLCALLFSAIGVFTRQIFLYMLECDQPLALRALGRACFNALRYGWTSTGMFFAHFPWFLGMLLLFLAGYVLATVFSMGAVGLFSFHIFLAYAMLLPRWAICAVWALTAVWLCGAGYWFWPRYHMARVYQMRSQMKESGLL